MSNWKIYHNPRCSKSRQTLELLKENGIEPTIVNYLENPPTVSELKKIVGFLNLPPAKIVRTKEAAFKSDSFDLENLDVVVERLSSNPKLLERPIVVKVDRAVIGRPPENILDLI